MNHNMIGDLILNDALELYGQPKWTFGKNTCNTYEVFVEKVHMPDGDVMPAWPVVELIERDEALTLLSAARGKETIDTFNTGESRGREVSHSLNYQKLGKELMSQEPVAPLCRS